MTYYDKQLEIASVIRQKIVRFRFFHYSLNEYQFSEKSQIVKLLMHEIWMSF